MLCYVSTKFRKSSSCGVLVITINPRVKENVCMVSILFHYILQKKLLY
jgi:hypothetical protein